MMVPVPFLTPRGWKLREGEIDRCIGASAVSPIITYVTRSCDRMKMIALGGNFHGQARSSPPARGQRRFRRPHHDLGSRASSIDRCTIQYIPSSIKKKKKRTIVWSGRTMCSREVVLGNYSISAGWSQNSCRFHAISYICCFAIAVRIWQADHNQHDSVWVSYIWAPTCWRHGSRWTQP